MPPPAAIRMKVLRNTGRISDVLDDSVTANNEEEFHDLIVMPYNPVRGKCAVGLRLLFCGLVSLTICSVIIVLIRDHESKSWLQSSQELLNFNKMNNDTQTPSNSQVTKKELDVCLIDDGFKFDCHPGEGATADKCLARGCCWKPLATHDKPWCYFQQGFLYYVFGNVTQTKSGLRATGTSVQNSPYPKDVKRLQVDAMFETENILRVKITDADKPRFEVPLNYKKFEKKSDRQSYAVKMLREGFKVFRVGESTPIFDATIAPVIYSDQFIEITTSLQSEHVYGIGEAVDSLKKNVNWSRYVLWNHDRIPSPRTSSSTVLNNYGSHPFYMVMDKSGRSYGVFMANSNAMEIVLQPAPSLTFRTIGGIIDLRIFIGPTPQAVVDQYTSVIGRPTIPPYWGLGFHLCRFNYKSVNHTEQILNKNLRHGIPIDVQWNDLDYMHNRNDFTYDPVKFRGLPEFIQSLHERGMRYVPLIDPGISAGEGRGKYIPFDSGVDMDIFIKNVKGELFVGKVWNPKSTVWPDFSHMNISQYWLRQMESFRKSIKYDGAWIDMNEPSNFYNGEKNGCVRKSSLDEPPYVPRVDGKKLYYKTICPSAKQALGNHYDLHNLYGTMETITTYKILGDLTSERPFVISRSTFPGQGHYGGHWTGDVVSNWKDLRQSIPQMLTFGLLGIPLVGADICGFNGNTTVDLCKRWHQLGAFYPFSRNHNTDDGIPQDPASLGPEVVEAAKETLRLRYDLLPYINTQFFRAHLTGQPVARPLFFEFPEDVHTFDISTHFMLGPGVMVVPILKPNFSQPTIQVYIPKGYWYSHYDRGTVISSSGEMIDLKVPENGIPILYRGGSVIIKQHGGMNTVESRKNPFYIEVYLSHDNIAHGEFFWDDGVSNLPTMTTQYNHYEFRAIGHSFSFEKMLSNYDVKNMTLSSIKINGVEGAVNEVLVNNVSYDFVFQNKTLELRNLNMQGTSWTDGFLVKWKYINRVT